jgi:hypothetical protein
MSDATTATAPQVFTLTDEMKASITRKSTREAQPSIFLDAITEAIADGEVKYTPITPEFTVSRIIGNLEKGQKALNVKLRIWDRHDAAPTPFVAFQVKTAPEAKAAK